MNVRALLTESHRRWNAQAGATEPEIECLTAAAPVPLPDGFLDLLRFSNGGEGDLALPPLLFVLDHIERIIESLSDPFLIERFGGFLFFGGNGGMESIAFDLRGGVPPWRVVMIDLIAGPESAETIAPNVDTFIEAIGLESPDAGRG